jgi:hypothetical protein
LRGSAWGREREAGESRGRRPPSRGTYLRDVGDQDRGGVGDDAEEGVGVGGEERRASPGWRGEEGVARVAGEVASERRPQW